MKHEDVDILDEIAELVFLSNLYESLELITFQCVGSRTRTHVSKVRKICVYINLLILDPNILVSQALAKRCSESDSIIARWD